MSATDRIREAIAQLRQPQPYVGSHTPIASRSVIQIGVDDAEALCDLADQAKRIHPSLHAVAMLLKDHNCRVTAVALERFHDDLGEILSRLEDKERNDG